MDEIFCKSGIKTIVFRNLTYLMETDGMDEFFPKIRNKRGVEFKFIRETFVLESYKDLSNEE